MQKIICGFILIFLPVIIFAHSSCGTAKLLQHLANKKNTISRTYAQSCKTEDFYDTVYSIKTEHFQIFYTKSGPHKTTEAYIDTLKNALEFAWNFHVKKSKMLPPLGDSVSYHYKQQVIFGLYPVEVLDLDLLRDAQTLLGGACHGCYGITIPSIKNKSASSLAIDNDFLYTPTINAKKDTLYVSNKICTYNVANAELFNDTHNYSYAKKWNLGLRVTAAHELYHAVQLRYFDMYAYSTFWLEASASGVEEIIEPTVDDYFTYLHTMSKAVGTPLDNMIEDYGAGIFYMYLYNHINANTDKFIWESFSKKPAEKFQYHLNEFAKKNKLSADSIFHDFVIRLAFTGTLSNIVDSSFFITSDQKSWPEFYKRKSNSVMPLDELSYAFYISDKPYIENFNGKASVAFIKENSYSIYFLPTTNSIDSMYVEFSKNKPDSTIWIFSHFNNENVIPTQVADSTLRAYPVPWRSGNLCFAQLPQNKHYIEIRNRRGNLVTKESYNKSTLCIDESKIKNLMVPGVYRFRAGNSGKLKDFIIIY